MPSKITYGTSILKKGLVFIALALSSQALVSQDGPKGIPLLDKLIADQAYTNASKELSSQINQLFALGNMDSLKSYPYYVGKIALETSNAASAISASEAFMERLKTNNISKQSLYKAYMGLTDFYDEIGDLNRSLEATQTTYEIISKVEGANTEEIGKIVYNLGVCHLSLGNVDVSKTYFMRALNLYREYSKTSVQNLSDGYNAMGAVMWMSTQLDSAKYYYTKGIQVLTDSKIAPLKNLFNATSIRSNVSLLEQSQGNLAAALKNHEKVIADYQIVINQVQDTELREKARQNQLIAIYNMSSFYIEIGNLGKGKEFMEYSYGMAKELLNPEDPELPRYQIALGEVELGLHNYNEVLEQCQKGLDKLDNIKVHDPFWKAKAYYAMAKANDLLENNVEALRFYQMGEQLFKEAFGNSYSREFLGFLREKSFFLLKMGYKEEAIADILSGYDYLITIQEQENLEYYKFLRDISQLYFEAHEYTEALEWAEKGLNALDKRRKEKNLEGLSVAQIDFYEPPLVLSKVKALYKLNATPSLASLKDLLRDLEEAITILERRKATALEIETRNLLNDEYNALNGFCKQLSLAIYEKTQQHTDLRRVLAFQESGIYANIRSKLNMPQAVSFGKVPDSIIHQEKRYKTLLSQTLSDSSAPVGDFFDAQRNWETFLSSLKLSFPDYYKMRYATLKESLKNFNQSIPKSTTLLRYFFIDRDLYAYIADHTIEQLVKLEFGRLDQDIKLLADHRNSALEIGAISKTLYDALWKPIAPYINHKNIVIFPDKSLFNLSFELLTPSKISSFEELSQQSLLSKFNISYNYSLLLLDNDDKILDFENDFVAFAPSFDRTMKDAYALAIKDSIALDKTYMTLLPQPFSSKLAEKFGKKFRGSIFLNQKASKQLFTKNAKEHKIIHIGTHAESNNVNPELSRLVFAKNVSDSLSINDNYLYTYEIYNQNLSSNLAILTACETGKPSYQPGEGMISLAHAFNYAGSESILTSLWQIDEQSSSQLLGYFYDYLEEGKRKDEALRLAKLNYLKTARGRTLHPQYWAGLVLMGDNAPIELSSNTHWAYWLIAGVLLALLLFYFKPWLKRS